jgi:hypothetical protein
MWLLHTRMSKWRHLLAVLSNVRKAEDLLLWSDEYRQLSVYRDLISFLFLRFCFWHNWDIVPTGGWDKRGEQSAWERREMHTQFCRNDLKQRDNLKDLVLDGNILRQRRNSVEGCGDVSSGST